MLSIFIEALISRNGLGDREGTRPDKEMWVDHNGRMTREKLADSP